MPGLVLAHLLDDGAAALILLREFLQVISQVLGNLLLGFGDKAQAPLVAGQTGGSADGERACVPERLQLAGAGAEFAQPLLAPAQVVLFFLRGGQQLFAYLAIAGGQRLALVERLRGDLAGVIDAHQPGGVAALGFPKVSVRCRTGRIGAAARHWRRQP
jgi:hypothetical protein